ncbi:MAG: hypothetical protein OXE59_09900 [Bacteroidetes bacterium]|nr:hypothetical protein [Bacteroidota bacterium]
MQIEVSQLEFYIALASAIFVILGTLLSIVFSSNRRNERSIERIEAKFDHSIERIEAKIDRSTEQRIEENKALQAKIDRSTEQRIEENKALQAKIDRSTEQRIEENKALQAKIDRSTEQLREEIQMIDAKHEHSVERNDAKLEGLRTQLYNLNGKINRLIGYIFGRDDLIEYFEEQEEDTVADL